MVWNTHYISKSAILSLQSLKGGNKWRRGKLDGIVKICKIETIRSRKIIQVCNLMFNDLTSVGVLCVNITICLK